MRCQGCDYALWNLTSRICPECGRAFAPSEFDFIANSVRFCCPRCNQDYYGTGPRGHLEPVEFDCAKCRAHIHMDQMVLLPTEGVKEEQTEVDHVPWLVRAKIGRFKGWYRTVWRAMFEPGRLARATPAGSGVGEAWRFSLISNLGYILFGAAPIFIFPLAFTLGRGPGASGVLVGIVMMALAGLAFIAALFPLWGLAAHLLLRLTGPTRMGRAASVRTLCYASGANACAALPCVGLYLSLPGALWTGLSAAAMFRVVHGVGWLRALVAGLGPPVAVLGLFVGWILIVIIPAVSSSSARYSAVQASGVGLSAALTNYRARHNGRFPPHGIALMLEGDLFASDLVSFVFQGGRRSEDAGFDPMSFQMLAPAQQAAVSERLAASLPAGVVAHRLGDVVFTYHGIDPETGDPGLWIAVEAPEPVGQWQPGEVTVVMLGGATLRIPRADFAAALARQNELRAPLAPLPDPATVGHAAGP